MVPRNLHIRSFLLRGLKTSVAARNDAESLFVPTWMKQHIFGPHKHGSQEKECSQDLNNGGTPPKPKFKLPDLCGNSIQSHIHEISEKQAGAYQRLLQGLACVSCPPVPDTWMFEPGWTCYRDGCEPQRVQFPDEDAMYFDAEVCVPESFAPVLATAASSTAWYSWVSPSLTDITMEKKKYVYLNDLVRMGNMGTHPRVIIGHYVCFDSARIQESYDIAMSGLKYFDTMAAHVSVSGITDLQRYFLLGSSEKPEWAKLASGNSLGQLYSLYCDKNIDKSDRDIFVKGSLKDIANQFQQLCTYCAMDVKATESVFRQLFPMYLERFPHGATLAALLEMSAMHIPVGRDYENVLERIKETSAFEDREVHLLLKELAEDALQLQINGKYKDDVWMWDQDWTIPKRRKNQEEPSSVAQDLPQWYKKIISQDKTLNNEKAIHINFRRNISAKLMQLCWSTYPLHYEQKYGWGLLMPALKATKATDREIPVESITKFCKSFSYKPRATSDPSVKDFVSALSGVTASNSKITPGKVGFKTDPEDCLTQFFIQNGLFFKKLPHHLSVEKNVGSALSINLLTNQCLRTGNPKAMKILETLRKNIFWKKSGKAFETLTVVWFDENLSRGAVVPSVSPCGDFSRLPREYCFSSLCHEPESSTGTEISTVLSSPNGWCFLSAILPQTDLWMSSLFSDSVHEKYCGSHLGQLFVNGTTYLELCTNLKLSEEQAALVLHAVIWGASKRFLMKLLREINPLLGEVTTNERADALLSYCFGEPKGGSVSHGLLSDFQSKLEDVSSRDIVVTPLLQSRLSRVLESNRTKFLPLIQNWLVRSSIADYLHVVMVCFRDLMPNARLCTVVSQELLLKYLVPENEKYEAAKALHIAHLYSAAFCAAQVGLNDVPKSVAPLPFVTLSSKLRGDYSDDNETLSFEEALEHAKY